MATLPLISASRFRHPLLFSNDLRLAFRLLFCPFAYCLFICTFSSRFFLLLSHHLFPLFIFFYSVNISIAILQLFFFLKFSSLFCLHFSFYLYFFLFYIYYSLFLFFSLGILYLFSFSVGANVRVYVCLCILLHSLLLFLFSWCDLGIKSALASLRDHLRTRCHVCR